MRGEAAVMFAAVLAAACGPQGDAHPDAGPGSPDASLLDECEGISVRESGNLDVDLDAVRIEGAVTLGGAPLPAESASRGQIVFSETRRGGGVSLDLEASGQGAYAVTLPPGTYRVELAANPGLCAGGELPEMPCVGAVLVDEIVIAADGVLDLDIPPVAMVRVTGVVSVNGAAMPGEDGSRGQVVFTEQTGAWTATADLGATGAADYEVVLAAGVYDVAFAGNPALCAGGAPAVPCNGETLREGVQVEASGVLDLDVEAVTVTGAVALRGGALPATGRGDIVWRRVDAPGSSLSVPVQAAGEGAYEVTLVPGDYVVSHAPAGSVCDGEMPCSRQVLRGCD